MKLIVGLGNPGEEYKKSRHNTGFIVLDFILGNNVPWKESGKAKALYYKGKIAKKEVEFIKPLTFMNNSGHSVSYAKKKHKIPLEDVVLVYDDIDLPLGTMKISFGKGSGGHNGIESVIKKLESKKFVRVRIGICPTTPSGKMRKPKGEERILKFLMRSFKDSEIKELKKLSKKVNESLEIMFSEGRGKAMSLYNN